MYSPICLSAVDMEVHGHFFVFTGKLRDDTGSGFFVCRTFSRIKVVKSGIWVSDKGGYMIGRHGYGPWDMDWQFKRLSGKGRVVDDACYSGDYYVLPFDGNEEEWKGWRKKTGMVNLAAAVFLLGIQVAAGMVNQDSSRTFWIVYPYLFLFPPLAYMFAGAAAYLGAPRRMQRVQYETGIARIRRSCRGAMALETLCAILDMVYIFLYFGEVRLERELLYLFCHILFLAAAFCYGRYYNRTYGGLRMDKRTE